MTFEEFKIEIQQYRKQHSTYIIVDDYLVDLVVADDNKVAFMCGYDSSEHTINKIYIVRDGMYINRNTTYYDIDEDFSVSVLRVVELDDL